MNILVTGSSGFIGEVLVETLANAGHRVFGLDITRPGMSADYLEDFVCIALGSVDRQFLLKDYKIQTVIHLAASHEVGRSVNEPGEFFKNNVSNTIQLINDCVHVGVEHFVFASTGSIYDMSHGVQNPPDRPQNPYAESKLVAEQILRHYPRAHPISITAMRYFNVAGADPRGRSGYTQTPATHLIPIIAKKILKGEPVSVYGTDYATPDGTALRDYIHVSDLAQAHLAVIDQYQLQGGYRQLDIGTGKPYSVMEVIHAAQDVVGHYISKDLQPRRAGDPAEVWLANPTQLNYQTQYNIHDMIQHALTWEQAQ